MSKYVLDSWAWIEYFEGSSRGLRVKELIFDPDNEIFTHPVSVAEIISKAKRSGKDPEGVWTAITTNSNILRTSAEECKNVGITHANMKSKSQNFSLADAFVLETARKLKAKVLAGDQDFRNIPGVVML